jgi:hypothetical protein
MEMTMNEFHASRDGLYLNECPTYDYFRRRVKQEVLLQKFEYYLEEKRAKKAAGIVESHILDYEVEHPDAGAPGGVEGDSEEVTDAEMDVDDLSL